jgi:transposase
VLKTGCRWRDCPSVFGPHTTVYNRCTRWSQAVIWQEMFERLAQLDDAHEQSIDSTISKARRCNAGGKGCYEAQALAAAEADGPPKINAFVDAVGRLLGFELNSRQKGGIRAAKTLLEPPPVGAALFEDAAYDSYQFRAFLTRRGITPVIPPIRHTKTHRTLEERNPPRGGSWRHLSTRPPPRPQMPINPSAQSAKTCAIQGNVSVVTQRLANTSTMSSISRNADGVSRLSCSGIIEA